jgi:prepilin-type N-terminal cleavage/methylation domain-containing protein
MNQREGGFTIVELLVSIVVLGIMVAASTALMTGLLHSAVVAKRQATALTLATNQMEYLKSLPYDNLAVAGGAIPATNTLPGTLNMTVNGEKYVVKTGIVYTDDAYDGCGSYPTLALKQLYCRDYPPPASAPAVDTNPADYKDVTVRVFDSGVQLALLDTNIAARVAETASNTGALFAKVIDGSGNPVTGATVNVTDVTLSPAVNVSDLTDENGIVIFYGLPPDTTNTHYNITASLSGYSTLSTINAAGGLQPTYPNQSLLAQNSSYVTLTLLPQGTNSLGIETTDVNGAVLANVKLYIKGGYKRYISAADTTYYYDNLRGSDTRPTTDSGGLTALTNLVPGDYVFCGDVGATSCVIGGTTYYVLAAVPYGGTNPFNPIDVPTYLASDPPPPTFLSGGVSYLQKVRLIMSSLSNYPRVTSMAPYDVSIAASNMSSLTFSLTGANLPCSATAASCSTQVKLVQGSNTYTASCTGAAAGLQVNCTINMSSAIVGQTQLIVTANSHTLTLPASPLIGGLIVNP